MTKRWSLVWLCAVLVLVASTGCAGAKAMNMNEPWDLVWYSDSTGFDLADMWGERINQELGVEVRVHDYSAGGLSAAQILQWIGTGGGSLPKMRTTVADAEIIVVYGNPEDSGTTSDIGTCVSTSPQPRDPPVAYSDEDFAPYRDVLTQIYDIIFELRKGNATIVRTYDAYNPVLSPWKEAGIADQCVAAWNEWSKSVHDVAAEYNVPVVPIYDLFNGPNHNEDPRDKGYIWADGQHPSDEGKAVMVQAFDAAGYEPVDR
jgi:hypothetical protein